MTPHGRKVICCRIKNVWDHRPSVACYAGGYWGDRPPGKLRGLPPPLWNIYGTSSLWKSEILSPFCKIREKLISLSYSIPAPPPEIEILFNSVGHNTLLQNRAEIGIFFSYINIKSLMFWEDLHHDTLYIIIQYTDKV